MNDGSLNSLLKWSVRNSDASRNPEDGEADPTRGLDQQALAQLLGGPSDADRMRASMAAIQSDELTVDNKLVAFDNLEQLIEHIDNANNMESLGLWTPLVEQLDNQNPEMARMAAWCIGTAVQNNVRAQERCLVVGAIPKLVHLYTTSTNPATKKKAVFALSSATRNYQPGLDALVAALPAEFAPQGQADASDMEAIDRIMDQLRAAIQ